MLFLHAHPIGGHLRRLVHGSRPIVVCLSFFAVLVSFDGTSAGNPGEPAAVRIPVSFVNVSKEAGTAVPHVWGSRDSQRYIIEVKGTIGPDLELPADEERVDFYFKFLPAPDGNGFDADPSLVYCYRETQTRSHKGVTGTVTLNESRFDPVVDIPMLGDPTITLSERRSAQRGEIVATVPSADLIPYQHQRYDDLSPVGKK